MNVIAELTVLDATVMESLSRVLEVVGSIARSWVLTKTFKMVVMASLLSAQELRVSTMTDLSTTV